MREGFLSTIPIVSLCLLSKLQMKLKRTYYGEGGGRAGGMSTPIGGWYKTAHGKQVVSVFLDEDSAIW